MSANQLDLVLLGDTSFTDPALFETQANRVRTKLLSVEPFRSRASQLNILWAVSPRGLNIQRSGRLLTCTQSYAREACTLLGLPMERGIVLVNTNTYGGSGGSPFAVTYCGLDGPAVAVHEFGHALAGLQDEYRQYAGGSVQNRRYKNLWLGPKTADFPYQVAKYDAWSRCAADCGMKTLNKPFCRACLEELNWALDALAEPCVLPDPEPSPTPAPTPTPTDGTGPTVRFTSPTADRTTSERFQVLAQGFEGTSPIVKMQLHLDDDLKGSAISKNVQGKWVVGWWWSIGMYAAGTYTLTASAVDTSGRIATASVKVTRP